MSYTVHMSMLQTNYLYLNNGHYFFGQDRGVLVTNQDLSY